MPRILVLIPLISLELGLVAQVLSIFHAFTPIPVVCSQFLFAAALWRWRAQLWQLITEQPPSTPLDATAPDAEHQKQSGTAKRAKDVQADSLRSRIAQTGWTPVALLLLVLISVLLLASLWRAVSVPIWSGDERHYHASRCLYWIENASIFPYTTHNDRQLALGYQGELFFLYPILLTRTEAAGQFVFWLGFPSAVLALFCLCRGLKASLPGSLAAAALYASAPQSLVLSIGLKPDHWLTTYCCLALCWALRANNWLLAGACAALAIHTRSLALPLAVVLLVMAIRQRSARPYGTGLLVGLAASGFLSLCFFNLRNFGGVFGSEAFQEVHLSDPSIHVAWTQAVRGLLIWSEPVLPLGSNALSATGRWILQHTGALSALPLEDASHVWPGAYEFVAKYPPLRFGMAGWIAGAALLAGLARAFRRRDASTWLWSCGALLFAAIVLRIRWMEGTLIPARFLLPSVAMLLAFAASTLRNATWLWLGTTLIAAYTGLGWIAFQIRSHRELPIVETTIDAPYGEAIAAMNDGARILYFGEQASPDYPLFLARHHYSREVYSWGKTPFDARRMENQLHEHKITHVLLQNEEYLGMHWDPAIDMRPAVAWLDHNPGWARVQLGQPGQRLYRRSDVPGPAPRIVKGEVPAGHPLFVFDSALWNGIDVSNAFLSIPWAEEFPGSVPPATWLARDSNAVRLTFDSKDARTVKLELDLEPGPSRTDANRTLVLHTDAGLSLERPFSARGKIIIDVPLVMGRNGISFWIQEPPTVATMPNGDTRPLLARFWGGRFLP